MNLDSCTPGQREIITTMENPLMVAAGAGSGKTFTLTQRIAYAFDEASSQIPGKGYVSHIDEVVAITFTQKAAAELKSRIKQRLLDLGHVEEALKVDDAWISTIHGMCARILREHALEIGISPAFEVITETDAAHFRQDAFNEVIQQAKAENSAQLEALFRRYEVTASSPNGASIEGFVTSLLSRVNALPGGFESLKKVAPVQQPGTLIRLMLEQGMEYQEVYAALAKPTKTDEKHFAALDGALGAAQKYLERFSDCAFDSPEFDPTAFENAFFAFPKLSAKYRSKEGDPGFFESYRQTYAELAAEAEAGIAHTQLQAIIEIAQRIEAAYARLKGPAKFDNTDLLTLTHRALTQLPSLGKAYRQRFKLIMIDEFQDTDELQVAIVRCLAKEDGSNICTVGDAQQSIYRFRGADVNVFYGFREQMQANQAEARFVSLPDNFRSHADVLSFVDAVFSQPGVFGQNFLSLQPKGAVNNLDDPMFENRPRINVGLFDCRRGGPGVAYGRKECARAIANHFAQLREAGAPPSSMVVLLGGMGRAQLYAQALREEGFECIVAGGSVFAQSEEVIFYQAAVRMLSNVLDSDALYTVLASPLFNISDNAFVHLASTANQKGALVRRSISDGFMALKDELALCALGESERESLDFAFLCVTQALRAVSARGLSAGMDCLLRASGWLMRMESAGAEGQAAVGNVLKAQRMLEDVEAEGYGLRSTVQRFCENLETMKLSPGALSTTSSNFVRIMTVHASKGLEFPHVAVAELRLSSKSEQLKAENIKGHTYVAFSPTLGGTAKSVASTLEGYRAEEYDGSELDIEYAETPGTLCSELSAYTALQESQEARRLLYVALTRASKSLYLGMVFEGNKECSYAGKGILGDLFGALQWEPGEHAPEQAIRYGGSAPAHLTQTVFTQKVEDEETVAARQETYAVPSAPVAEDPLCIPFAQTHEEVFSYSSLPHVQAPEYLQRSSSSLGASDAFAHDGKDEDGAEGETAATLLGTAFHVLAQSAIEARGAGSHLCMPSADEVHVACARFGLDSVQSMRLNAALRRWFASDVARSFADHETLLAEVPFMLALGNPEEPVFLEGEIDGLAFDDEQATAYLIDYKTGGSSEEDDAWLREKHKLQAQCYALALLRQGFSEVHASFVRVEQQCASEPEQPHVVMYRFSQEQASELETGILCSYRNGIARNKRTS